MLRPKKVHLFSIFIVSIVSIVLALSLITAQHVSRRTKSVPQSQSAAPVLREVAKTNSAAAKAQDSTRLQVEASYGRLPLSFEPNRGQTDPRVKFISRAGNRMLWLTADEAVLAVSRPRRAVSPDAKLAAGSNDQTVPAVLRMKFAGANRNARVSGESRQSGTVNYFGGKPDQWRTKIPMYGRVRYRSLYPGIDLVFYGNNRELEYDLVVSPGADPGQIKLAVAGADEIRIDAEGNLVLKTSQGDVIQQKPKTYQRKGATLTAVAGNYVITGKDEVGFRLGSYDRQAAVVIDPVLRYSTFLGGNDFDSARAIAVDSANRAVVVGSTVSSNFPATTSRAAIPELFVTKFDFTGSRIIYSSLLVGFVFDLGQMGLALDSAGNSYITGIVESNGFPTTPGAFQTEVHGDFDVFVTKLNANGSALVYSTFLGGNGRESGQSIAVDSSGNAYVTGDTSSEDFPTTPGAFQPACKVGFACSSAFVTKFNADGSHLLYSTFLGGAAGGTTGGGIAVDRLGNAFVTGMTNAPDFPTTAGSAQPVFPGGGATFVSEVSSSGSHLIYSTFLNTNVLSGEQAIALDSAGNAFAASGSVVTKLSPSGRRLYATNLTGASARSIAVTPGGQAVVTGLANSNFVTTQTAFQRIVNGEAGNFITKLDPAGKFIYSSFLGTALFGATSGVALDRDANAYVTGTATPGFPVTPGTFQQKFGGGGQDAFVAKVVSLCALSTVNRSVTICSPASGSTVASPVRIIAGTTDVTPVKLTQVYLDGKKIYEAGLSAINVGLPIPGGTHRLTVQGLDTANVFFKKSISVNVSPH